MFLYQRLVTFENDLTVARDHSPIFCRPGLDGLIVCLVPISAVDDDDDDDDQTQLKFGSAEPRMED